MKKDDLLRLLAEVLTGDKDPRAEANKIIDSKVLFELHKQFIRDIQSYPVKVDCNQALATLCYSIGTMIGAMCKDHDEVCLISNGFEHYIHNMAHVAHEDHTGSGQKKH